VFREKLLTWAFLFFSGGVLGTGLRIIEIQPLPPSRELGEFLFTLIGLTLTAGLMLLVEKVT